MSPFERLSSRTVWEHGFLRVEELQIRAPSGDELDRIVVRHPGAVAMVAVEDDEVVLIEQYRVPLGRALLELPAGTLDVDGESPLECARRELAEEVALAAARWTQLASFTTSPGFCDEIVTVYLAEGLSAVAGDPQGDEEQSMTLRRVPLAAVDAMVASGEIADAKTIIGLLLARDRFFSS